VAFRAIFGGNLALGGTDIANAEIQLFLDLVHFSKLRRGTIMNSESKKKPKYEKPVAMSLEEDAKGSGECNAGSAVMPGYYADCTTGSGALHLCSSGGGAAVHST
jgi:hypothetical protein